MTAPVGRGAPVRAAAPHGAVLGLAAVERLVAHAGAGAAVRVASLDDKFALADLAEVAMAHAVRWRDHALALAARDPSALVADPAWAEVLGPLDRPDDPHLLVTIRHTVVPFLRDAYAQLVAASDEIYDARLRTSLQQADADWSRLVTDAGDRAADNTRDSALRAGLGACWAAAMTDRPAARAPLDDLVWAPRDRVPDPARPSSDVPFEPGAPLELYETSRAEPANVRHALHEAVLAETCALELMARTSYEHPELPWSFHLAAARHAADEARHARVFGRLLDERGGRIGEGPIHTTLYSALYQFPACEPGGPRELVWRLLVLSTALEGLAIDQFAYEQQVWEALGEPALAQATGYVLDDELFHAENGLRWTAELCAANKMDPAFERELAHATFLDAQARARRAYLDADPDRAVHEEALLAQPDPDAHGLHSTMQTELRRRAGFTEHEIDQARRWAYHPDDRPHRNPGPDPLAGV